MITIDLWALNPTQLAELFLTLTDAGMHSLAREVLMVGDANCGEEDFNKELDSVADKLQRSV